MVALAVAAYEGDYVSIHAEAQEGVGAGWVQGPRSESGTVGGPGSESDVMSEEGPVSRGSMVGCRGVGCHERGGACESRVCSGVLGWMVS